MNRWQTQKDFIKWVTRERNKHKTFSCCLIDNFEKYPKKYNKDITCEFATSLRNSTVNPLQIKALLTDEVLEHLNAYLYNKDIGIFHIYRFLKTIESVNLFKLSKFSNDAQAYRREVKQLKKMADKLQLFLREQITVQIPILPFISIYKMIIMFKRYGLSDDEIYIFSSYFGLNNRYRKTKSFTLYTKRENKISYNILKRKIKETEDYSKERKKKYDGWSYRTEKEYNEMIEKLREIDKRYDEKKLDKTYYYKPINNII